MQTQIMLDQEQNELKVYIYKGVIKEKQNRCGTKLTTIETN